MYLDDNYVDEEMLAYERRGDAFICAKGYFSADAGELGKI